MKRRERDGKLPFYRHISILAQPGRENPPALRDREDKPISLRIIAILLLLVIGGGLAFLLTWDIPPPPGPIEKVLPDERFDS